jgi:hypothetical protein
MGDKQQATGPAASKAEQDEEFQKGLQFIKKREWAQVLALPAPSASAPRLPSACPLDNLCLRRWVGVEFAERRARAFCERVRRARTRVCRRLHAGAAPRPSTACLLRRLAAPEIKRQSAPRMDTLVPRLVSDPCCWRHASECPLVLPPPFFFHHLRKLSDARGLVSSTESPCCARWSSAKKTQTF